MYVSNPIPATVQINRGYLLASAAMIAAIAAGITWALFAYTNGGDSVRSTRPAPTASATISAAAGYVDTVTAMTPATLRATFGTVSAADMRSAEYVQAIASLTPQQRVAAFGTDDRAAAALSSLDPKARLYVESITAMTPEQRLATFGIGR